MNWAISKTPEGVIPLTQKLTILPVVKTKRSVSFKAVQVELYALTAAQYGAAGIGVGVGVLGAGVGVMGAGVGVMGAGGVVAPQVKSV